MIRIHRNDARLEALSTYESVLKDFYVQPTLIVKRHRRR